MLQKTSVVCRAAISAITWLAAYLPEWPDQGTRPSGIRMVTSGSAPASPSTGVTASISPSGASQAR